MDQRPLDTSAVRCAGHTLILQASSTRLRAAVNLDKDFVSQHGLGYTVRNLDRVSNRCAAVLR